MSIMIPKTSYPILITQGKGSVRLSMDVHMILLYVFN